MKILDHDEVDVTADRERLSTLFAVQSANPLAGIRIVGAIVKVKRAGISRAENIFIRLPHEITQRTPDLRRLGRSELTYIVRYGVTGYRAIHDIAG